MVEVHLRAVRVDLGSSTPVVLLEETEGARRSLPIFVGGPEATAIAFALQGVEPPRPMSHDLMRELVEALGAKVVRVLVTELRDGTFFAELHLRAGRTRRRSSPAGRPTRSRSRPGHALRCTSPTTSWRPRAS